ncbi:exopolyphosphatase PRUNE1 isoform X2 [Nilaparvata lugens]|uniref:exopolyphosphatase PRUNE1 isoform X1 n=1 Tax=Nilaparvata lugens TaxID=108931 RepID=UPI00193D17FE|nr:exopolyphosphatase PRUNE1 isoform X1 [Nilaparvata lugens]XP_039290856.1 exopolyphosphatase PRUNE1 isoform X2 [Nilaparvata lugens]
MSSSKLNDFLQSSRRYDEDILGKKRPVTVVIGNESCDLDSAVSSITYAYFLSLESPPDCAVVPVINVLRKHYDVKTEVKYFLNHNNIEDNMLVFRDEIDLNALHSANRLELVLVDHHVLPADMSALSAAVTRVLDHRPRVDTCVTSSPHVQVDIRPVGSCVTLVGRHLDSKGLLSDRQVATLVYGTILLDTSNFSPITKKATDLDREVAALCETKAHVSNAKDLYDRLVAAKTDTSRLSTYSLLIKDMKKVHGIPLSVLTMSVKDFLERPDAEANIKEFCTEHEARVMLILGVIVTGGSQLRDLFIYPNTCQPLADKIEEHLKASTAPKLDLHMVENKFGGKIFKEINTYSTRKQVLPIVERAILSYDSETRTGS